MPPVSVCHHVSTIGDFFFPFVLKCIYKSVVGEYHITTTGMHHAFWFSCRTGSIQNEQRVFSIHLFCRKRNHSIFLHLRFCKLHFIFPPYISAFYHRNTG